MKQKVTILFLVRLYHPHIGGVEKHVREVCRQLLKKGYSITIITERHEKNLDNFENIDGVAVYRIPIPKSEALKKFSIWKWVLLHFSMFYKSDIIHVHDVFFWILPFRFFFPRKKVYITFHGYEGYPIKMRWIILRKVSELMSNGTICVGDFMKKWYFANPTNVIYGAVELNGIKTKPKPYSIVFFGRLEQQTNALEYTKGFQLLQKNSKKWSFTVYGEGFLSKKIGKIAEIQPFEPRIDLVIPKYEYVFVSRYLSILEALALKRLVFAFYDNELKKDYLLMSPFKDCIIVVNSPEELADKVEYYSKNEAEREKIIESGFNFAKKQTWEKMMLSYLQLWGAI